MSELLGSKKFKSAVIGTIIVTIQCLLFGVLYPNTQLLLMLVIPTGSLFGLQITGQGLADLGKSKQQEHANFIKEMQANGAVIQPPPGVPLPPVPQQQTPPSIRPGG